MLTEVRASKGDAVKLPTIIVVDDDPELRLVLGDVLEDEGYPVRRARDGFEALEEIHACEGHRCVVLLDMMMPGMNGAEVLRALRNEGSLPMVPVIVLTAARPAFEETAGARMCLHKPIDFDVLLRVVAHVAPEASNPPLVSCTQMRAGSEEVDEPVPMSKR
jgi:CheY-like chemotaxis protein